MGGEADLTSQPFLSGVGLEGGGGGRILEGGVPFLLARCASLRSQEWGIARRSCSIQASCKDIDKVDSFFGGWGGKRK